MRAGQPGTQPLSIKNKCWSICVADTPMLVVVARLRTRSYVVAQHLLHHSDLTTSSSTSEECWQTDENLLHGHSYLNSWSVIDCRLENAGFYSFCSVVSLLAVCNYWLSLLFYVRYGFLSDESLGGEIWCERGMYCGHSVYLYFWLLCELLKWPISILVCHGLCADILWEFINVRTRTVARQ